MSQIPIGIPGMMQQGPSATEAIAINLMALHNLFADRMVFMVAGMIYADQDINYKDMKFACEDALCLFSTFNETMVSWSQEQKKKMEARSQEEKINVNTMLGDN